MIDFSPVVQTTEDNGREQVWPLPTDDSAARRARLFPAGAVGPATGGVPGVGSRPTRPVRQGLSARLSQQQSSPRQDLTPCQIAVAAIPSPIAGSNHQILGQIAATDRPTSTVAACAPHR